MRKNKQYLSQVEKRLEIVFKEDSIELSKVEIQHQTNSKVKKRRRGRATFSRPAINSLRRDPAKAGRLSPASQNKTI